MGHVTNGVHMPTWDSAAADELWTQPAARIAGSARTAHLERDIRRIRRGQLWQFRNAARLSLIEFARDAICRGN